MCWAHDSHWGCNGEQDTVLPSRIFQPFGRGIQLQSRAGGWGCYSQNLCSQNPPHPLCGSGHPLRALSAPLKLPPENPVNSHCCSASKYSPALHTMQEATFPVRTKAGRPRWSILKFWGEFAVFYNHPHSYLYSLQDLWYRILLHFLGSKKESTFWKCRVPSHLCPDSLSLLFRVTEWQVTFLQGCSQFCRTK